MDRVTLDQIRAWLDADLLAEPELNLTSYEHAAQTAELAPGEGADDDLVVAAFSMRSATPRGGHDHGRWASGRLAGSLPEWGLWLIEHHITAKRWACTADPPVIGQLVQARDHPTAPFRSSLIASRPALMAALMAYECVEYENATPLHRLYR